MLQNELNTASTLKGLRESLYRKGWFMKIQYEEAFNPNQKNEIQDFKIIKVGLKKNIQLKEGFFYNKKEGFSLSAIDSTLSDFTKEISRAAEMKSNEWTSNIISKSTNFEILKDTTGELIDEFLKPYYVAQEDEWWKKKKKGRR